MFLTTYASKVTFLVREQDFTCDATVAADQGWRERGTELWVYRCGFCGTWHLTHRDPQSSYTYVPLNQQIKPHSRKKGYKPRRK